MKLVALALTAVLAVAGSPGILLAQEKDAALEKLVADWTAAYGRADTAALAQLYTPDAIRVTQQGATKGRAEIQKEFESNFKGLWKGTTIKIDLGEVRPLGPDVAVVEGTFEISGLTGPDGEPMPMSGRYLNTVVKKDGAWLLASNAALPPGNLP